MFYKIVPKYPVTAVIEAEDECSAMGEFAWNFNDDLNTYFKAVPASDEEVKEYGEETAE